MSDFAMTTSPAPRLALPDLHRQRGAALIVSLLFLVMLTLIGVGAMTTTTLEEKMAGNARDYNVALQAGEAALKDAWADINTRVAGLKMTGFGTACPGGLCQRSTTTSAPVWTTMDWSSAGPAIVYGSKTGAAALPGVNAPPRYVLELLPDPKSSLRVDAQTFLYRATARGFGTSETTRATVQATYRPR